MRRVVVTGLGAITPLGDSFESTWEALLRGENGISRITRFDASSFASQIAGQIENFEPTKRINPKEARKMDRYSQFALYAAYEAVEDAGLHDFKELDRKRIGVIFSSGIGGIQTLESENEKLIRMGARRVSPFLVPMMIPNIAAGLISITFGFRGPNYAIVSACASSSNAIGESFRTIRYGDADIVLTGGSEAPITPLSMAGFSNMRALSTRNDSPEKASRPFDLERDGFVVGEGAGVLILEELEHAKRRGAKIYAEVKGYGATADAYHITAPDPEGDGAYWAMRLALEDGKLSPEDIDYINAHGTSTPYNDKIETAAIKRLFKDYAPKLWVNSSKSMLGHLLGAAGGVEAIVTVLSLARRKVHPTRNLENPDPECDLDYVREGMREKRLRNAFSNSFGFGGHNAVILFSAYS